MRTTTLALTLFLAGASRVALAQEAPWTSLAATANDISRSDLFTRHGMSLTLGLGTTGLINKGARELTDTNVGGYVDVRATYGTRSFLGVEAAYTFSGRGLANDQFGPDSPALLGHGLEGLVRVNYPMHDGRLFFSPFAVAGLGWTGLVRTDAAGDGFNVRTTDSVGTIPMGIGFAVSYRIAYAELRAMYRPTYGENDITGSGRSAPNMQAWFGGIAAGLEF